MVILIPFCFPMVDKNVRHLADKQFRHPHSERKAGVIFVSFNGVYCLPRHTQLPGQFTLAPPSCLAIVFQTVFQLAPLDDKSSLQFEHLPVKNSCHLRKIGCLVGDCCYWFRCPYSGLTEEAGNCCLPPAFHGFGTGAHSPVFRFADRRCPRPRRSE